MNMLKKKFNSVSAFLTEPHGNWAALFIMSAMSFLAATAPEKTVSLYSLCAVSALSGVLGKSVMSSIKLLSMKNDNTEGKRIAESKPASESPPKNPPVKNFVI